MSETLSKITLNESTAPEYPDAVLWLSYLMSNTKYSIYKYNQDNITFLVIFMKLRKFELDHP